MKKANGHGPSFLGLQELISLQEQYAPPPPYNYSAEALQARGEERAEHLQRLLDGTACDGRPRSLEVACLDGMVSATLQQQGWQAVAIDRESRNFDRRTVEAGAGLMTMDVTSLGFPDDSFDITFSYDAFEHIDDPSAALGEMIRVTRDGGLIYLNFGPLYNSALGLHAYRSIRVPFCQFLFDRQTLDEYCRRHGLRPIKYDQLNEWSLGQFRALWRSYADRLQRERYMESWSTVGMELVERFPSCFTTKDKSFEELAVAHIDAVFRVKKR